MFSESLPLSEITLDQFKTATGTKLVTFKFAGEIYRQNRFALMLQDMLKLLDKRHPNILKTLAIAHFSLNSANQKHPYLDMSGTAMRSPVEIKPGIFVEINLSANSMRPANPMVRRKRDFFEWEFTSQNHRLSRWLALAL